MLVSVYIAECEHMSTKVVARHSTRGCKRRHTITTSVSKVNSCDSLHEVRYNKTFVLFTLMLAAAPGILLLVAALRNLFPV